MSFGSGNLNGTDENELIHGQGVDDVINGFGGIDLLYGGDGNDQLFGGNGNDILFGGEGNDSLEGGAGVDRLVGGNGNDFLFGGSGSDSFIFNQRDFGSDVISDFEQGVDRIEIDRSVLEDAGVTLTDVLGSMTASGGSVFVKIGNSDQIEIKNTSLSDMTSADFVLIG